MRVLSKYQNLQNTKLAQFVSSGLELKKDLPFSITYKATAKDDVSLNIWSACRVILTQEM